jgi:hypothetical protein
VSAQGDEAWVSGGLTWTFNATRPPLPPAMAALCSECVAVKAAQPPTLGATFQRRFNVGLHAMSTEGSRHYDNTNVDSYQVCSYDLKDWINEYNTAQWAAKPISWSTIQSTQGMLIFGAIVLVRYRARAWGLGAGRKAAEHGTPAYHLSQIPWHAFPAPLCRAPRAWA